MKQEMKHAPDLVLITLDTHGRHICLEIIVLMEQYGLSPNLFKIVTISLDAVYLPGNTVHDLVISNKSVFVKFLIPGSK